MGNQASFSFDTAPPHRLRFDIAGCHHAAIILERIQYWTPRTRVKRKDGAWIAKSRADLMRETGLTEKQVRTALERLKTRDLIETSRHDFGGETILHLRFSLRGTLTMRDAGLLKAEQPAPEGQTAMAPQGQTAMALEGHSLTQGDIDKGIYTSGFIPEKTSNEVSPGIAISLKSKITGKRTDIGEAVPKKGAKAPTPLSPAPKLGLSSADASAKLSARGKGVPHAKNSKKLSLGAVWQDAMAKAYPKEFHPGLTMQAQGQLSQLAKKLPGLDVEAVVRSIISDWPSFTEKCTRDAKAFDVPLRPMAGFALKYVAQAANFKAKPAKVKPEAGTTTAPGSFKEVWNG